MARQYHRSSERLLLLNLGPNSRLVCAQELSGTSWITGWTLSLMSTGLFVK